MTRRLLNLATALSLLLCVAVAGLWLRGHLAAEGMISGAAPVPGRGPYGWSKRVPRFEPLWLVTDRRGDVVWSFGAGHGEFVVEAGPAVVDTRPGPPPALDDASVMRHMLWILTLLWLAGVLLALTVSVVCRRLRGRYVFRPVLPDAVFVERWRSGRSLRHSITGVGGAKHWLWVTVTPRDLLVGPHFPFSLVWLSPEYKLEYQIRLRDVRGAEEHAAPFGGRHVSIRFNRPEGGEETLELHLVSPSRFLSAIDAANP